MRQRLWFLVGIVLALLAFPGITLAAEYFSVVVLPDTQVYSKSHPEIFKAQTEWIVRNQDYYNIRFVLHAGDVVDSGAAAVAEWEAAKAAIDLLDAAGIPTLIAIGNHDYDDLAATRSSTMFNQYFGLERYEGKPWFGGAFEPGKAENVYALFDAGGETYMVLVLEFGPRDEVIDWANEVVAAHPEAKVIVLTHSFLHHDGWRVDEGTEWSPNRYGLGADANAGEALWHKLVKRHPNIFLVLNGHVLGSGTARRVDLGEHGNFVYQLLANYQMRENGGDGYLRLVEFYPDGRIEVSTYSPYAWANLTDPANQFVLDPDGLAVISGTLLDQATRQAIAGAAVTLHDAYGSFVTGVRTDETGRYDIVAPEGCYVIRAEMFGYEGAAGILSTPGVSGCAVGTLALQPLRPAGLDLPPYVWAFEDEAELATIGNDNTGATFALVEDIGGEGRFLLQVMPSGESAETKIAAPLEGIAIYKWMDGETMVVRTYFPPENELQPAQFFVGMADLTDGWEWVDGLFATTELVPGWNEIEISLPPKMRDLKPTGTYMVYMSFIEADRTPLAEPFYVDYVTVR